MQGEAIIEEKDDTKGGMIQEEDFINGRDDAEGRAL